MPLHTRSYSRELAFATPSSCASTPINPFGFLNFPIDFISFEHKSEPNSMPKYASGIRVWNNLNTCKKIHHLMNWSMVYDSIQLDKVIISILSVFQSSFRTGECQDSSNLFAFSFLQHGYLLGPGCIIYDIYIVCEFLNFVSFYCWRLKWKGNLHEWKDFHTIHGPKSCNGEAGVSQSHMEIANMV